MSWLDLIGFEDDYEIYSEYPYQIRRKRDGYVLKETIDGGYYRVQLNGRLYLKHRIIAEQFIENPDNFEVVDHKNKIKTDNHILNLRWVSQSTNCKNKSGNKGVEYTIIDYDDCPDDLVQVRDYGKHEFEDYYYSPEINRFYFDTGVDLRELHINFTKTGYAYVYAMNVENKKVKICFTKFKKLYGFDF